MNGRIIGWFLWLVLGALCLGASAAYPAETNTPRLAILAADAERDTTVLADLLTAGLSKDDSVAVVERAEIAKALPEKKRFAAPEGGGHRGRISETGKGWSS